MKYLKLFETYEEEKLDSYNEFHKFNSKLSELFKILGLKFTTVIQTDNIKTYHCVANFNMNLNEVKYSIVWLLLQSFTYFKTSNENSKVYFVSTHIPYSGLGQLEAIICDEDVKINFDSLVPEMTKYTIHPESADDAFTKLIELPKNALNNLSNEKLQIDGTYLQAPDTHFSINTLFAIIRVFIDSNNKLNSDIDIPTTILDAIINVINKIPNSHKILNEIKINNPILYSKLSSYNKSTDVSSALGGIGF